MAAAKASNAANNCRRLSHLPLRALITGFILAFLLGSQQVGRQQIGDREQNLNLTACQVSCAFTVAYSYNSTQPLLPQRASIIDGKKDAVPVLANFPGVRYMAKLETASMGLTH